MKRVKKCEQCNKQVSIIVTTKKDRHCYCARHGREALVLAEKRQRSFD